MHDAIKASRGALSAQAALGILTVFSVISSAGAQVPARAVPLAPAAERAAQPRKASLPIEASARVPVVVKASPTGASNATPSGRDFDPAKHGYGFDNTNWGKVCYGWGGGGSLEYDANGSLCGDDWGLCGGMSLSAGERFLAGKATHDVSQDAAKDGAVDAQFRTLTGATVTKFMSWIASPDEGHTLDVNHSVGYRMKEDWEEQLKPRFDAGELAVLGLVFDKRATLISGRSAAAALLLSQQHQVLGLSATQNGKTVEIRAYDPNYHDDTLVLTFTLGSTGVTQRLLSGKAFGPDRRTPRGVMFVRGVSSSIGNDKPCPSGKFSTMGDYHGCDCLKGRKTYGGVASSEAWCEGAEACPSSGKFSTTDNHRGCYCAKGTKTYGGIGDSEAWCEGAAACPSGKFSTTDSHRGCYCAKGTKKYGGIGDSEAWCEGANACPSGKFSTTDNYRGCYCASGTKKYGGIGDSEAWCEGGQTCPSGKFSTTDSHRGCKCPSGKHKKYYGLFDSEARCE